MARLPLRIGIIGTGSRGLHCFGLLFKKREDVKVVALCDPNPVRVRFAAEFLGHAPAVYPTAAAMLAETQLDAAVVTSPDYTHEANAVAALESGVNVLVDKPLATTVKGCRNIIRAAEKGGKVAMVGFNLRHDPTLARLKQIIAAGTLGRVFLIENREFYNGGRTYMARWNRRYEWSGGLWVHKGSHDFDVFNWLLDHAKPAKVSSFAGVNVLNPGGIPFPVAPGKPVGPTCHACAYRATCPDAAPNDAPEWTGDAYAADKYARDLCIYTSDKDTHDNGFAIVEYENGARASHMECFVTPMSDRLYTVVGDRGQAEASLHSRIITVRPRWSRDVMTYQVGEAQGGHGGADPGLVESFVNILRGEASNTTTLEHGLWSTAVGQAAEISRREGRVVTIAELLAG